MPLDRPGGRAQHRAMSPAPEPATPPADLRVGVLLLNWNTWEVSEQCLLSLRRLDPPPWRVTVVDNASRDDSAERVAAAFPEVTLLRQSRNLGFAGGNNVGMRQLLDAGADAVWILNNDTVADPDCLGKFTAALRADPAVGVVTHRIDYVDPPDRLWYAGGRIRPWTFGNTHDRMGRPVAEAGEERDVTFVCACSMLVRAEVLRALGGFHDDFFALVEDVDWSLRATAAGIRMRYLPQARVVHLVSAAFRKNASPAEGGAITARSHYLAARNRTYLLRLHARGLRRATAWTVWFGFHLWLLTGLAVKARGTKLRALARGLRHGLVRPIAPVPPGSFEASDRGRP